MTLVVKVALNHNTTNQLVITGGLHASSFLQGKPLDSFSVNMGINAPEKGINSLPNNSDF